MLAISTEVYVSLSKFWTWIKIGVLVFSTAMLLYSPNVHTKSVAVPFQITSHNFCDLI